MHQAGSGEVKIVHVLPGTGAEETGLRAGDVILAVDGRKISTVKELADRSARGNPGEEVGLLIRRENEQFTVRVTLAETGANPFNPYGRSSGQGDSDSLRR